MTYPVPDEIWSLAQPHVGKVVHVFDQLDSTNTLALQFGENAENDGLVLLARSQTGGRGQYGRVWQAPPESSVLMSVVLFPPKPLRRPAVLTAWAAVAVCETILKLTNLQAKIKWPNDVLIQGKKVCGILIEQRTTGQADFPLASVTGIGLNVAQSACDFEAANLPDAASLASSSGERLDYETVARELISQLDQHYVSMVEGELNTLESLWKWRLGLLGKNVIAEGVQQSQRGRLLDVTFAGIELQLGDEILRVAPESIRHLHAVD